MNYDYFHENHDDDFFIPFIRFNASLGDVQRIKGTYLLLNNVLRFPLISYIMIMSVSIKWKRKTFLTSDNQKGIFSFAVKGLNTQTLATIRQCIEHLLV